MQNMIVKYAHYTGEKIEEKAFGEFNIFKLWHRSEITPNRKL